MKKILAYFLLIVLSVFVFIFNFSYDNKNIPNTYYNVYLDNEFVGMIDEKEELEKYINSQADDIRKNVKNYKLIVNAIDTFNDITFPSEFENYSNEDKVKYALSNSKSLNLNDMDEDSLNFYLDEKLYNYSNSEVQEMRDYVNQNDIYLSVENVYTPNGIEIEKVYTYKNDLKDVKEVYKKIISKKSCSIAGYVFTIKSTSEGKEDLTIYTTDPDVFSDAIESVITIFVDDDQYKAYKENNQPEISTTGKLINNIYVEEEITYKAVNISVDEKIYTSSNDLSAYLLYGEDFEEKTVEVKVGDSIESIALDNKISVQEFLIFNPIYTDRYNLIAPNTEVTIAKIDPKIQIAVEEYEVKDQETDFDTIEQYDPTLPQGRTLVVQEGQPGEERITQNVKSVNGQITYIDPEGKEVIKSAVSKIVKIGTKFIPNVGSTSSWGWPTNSGYTLSSYYGYRLAVFGEGNFHSGIDIAGTGYGSPVKAANNGTIEEMKVLRDKKGNYTSYGIYILINHNNGYYSLYGHMSRFEPGLTVGSTVSRGDVIGYVGSTGWATGPHLHFEIRTCASYSCTTNPLSFYR